MRLFITVGQIAFLPCAAQRGFGVKAFVSIAGGPFVFLLCFAFCRTWRQMLSPALSRLHANKHTQHHKACNPIYKETLDKLCVFVGSTKLCWSIVDSVKGDLVLDEVHQKRVFRPTPCTLCTLYSTVRCISEPDIGEDRETWDTILQSPFDHTLCFTVMPFHYIKVCTILVGCNGKLIFPPAEKTFKTWRTGTYQGEVGQSMW